jgi:hypothetical protein
MTTKQREETRPMQPRIPLDLRERVSAAVPSQGLNATDVTTNALVAYLEQPSDLAQLQAVREVRFPMRLPESIYDAVLARAEADTAVLQAAAGSTAGPVVTRSDVVVAALSAALAGSKTRAKAAR